MRVETNRKFRCSCVVGWHCWITAAALLSGSCNGVVTEGPSGRPPAPGTPQNPNAIPDPDAIPAGYEPGEVIPAGMGLRRLTNAEYDRTVIDLLGAASGISERFTFRGDTLGETGFDNQVITLGLSAARATEYHTAAVGLAQEVIESDSRRQAVIGCDLVGEGNACLRSFVQQFGRRAFRRALRDDEISRLEAIAALAPPDAGPFGGAALVLETILQSPRFLFRVELGTETTRGTNRVQLTGYEIATRLSYLLWGSTPDDNLLTQAEGGMLESSEGVELIAAQMLDDEKARRGVRAFAERWLRLTKLPSLNETRGWDGDLAAAAAEETLRTFDSFVWEGNRDFLDLLTTQESFVNDQLAGIYGLDGIGSDWEAVRFDPGSGRAGLLTQASFLAVTGNRNDLITPVLRGKYVREMFLCETIPPPPANAGEPPEVGANASVRERWAPVMTGDSACTACHRLMNPLGYGLEQYDAVGRYRTEDADGNPLTGEGVLETGAESLTFRGPMELAALLRGRPATAACIAKQLHRFAHGRPTGARDDGAVSEYTGRFQNDSNNFRSLVLALVTSDAFRFGIPE